METLLKDRPQLMNVGVTRVAKKTFSEVRNLEKRAKLKPLQWLVVTHWSFYDGRDVDLKP